MELLEQEAHIYLRSRVAIIVDRGGMDCFRNKFLIVVFKPVALPGGSDGNLEIFWRWDVS